MIDPPDPNLQDSYSLILAEGGGMGVSEDMDPQLKLWSWKVNDGTDGQWVLTRVIYLGNLLPNASLVDAACSVRVMGFAEGANVIFVLTSAGLFTIELQSGRARKVCDHFHLWNLIPVVGFYTLHSRLKALEGEHHDPPPLRNPTKEEPLQFACEMFNKGCKAMQEGNFASASDCFSRALKIRVLHYGKLAPQCASTFYRYGYALLCKALAVTNPLGSVSKSALNEESVKITSPTSKDDAGSSAASGSNVKHVPPLERGDSEEGDRSRAIGYYLEDLAILKHLVRPDHLKVVHLNFRICLVFELASRVEHAIPYCAKAISLCKSHIQNLKNAKKGLLADKDISASAAGGHSGKINLEDKISSVTRILAQLQKKLEELEQTMSTQRSGIDKIMKRVVSETSDEQNASNTVGRAAYLDSQVAESNNSVHFQTMPRAAPTSSVNRGIKQANDELISAEPSLKRLVADD